MSRSSQTAVRGHENPALDAALAAAAALRLPLLVAAFVLPGANCQAHGNLRRIKFQLEGRGRVLAGRQWQWYRPAVVEQVM